MDDLDEIKSTSVPYLVHEENMVRMERTIHKLWVLCLALLICLVGTNAGWIYYESQWEVVSDTQNYEITSSDNGNAVFNQNGEVRINGIGESNEDPTD